MTTASLALAEAGDPLAEMAARFIDKSARRDLVVAVIGAIVVLLIYRAVVRRA